MYRERRAESEDSLAIRGGGLHGYLRFLKNVIDPILISRGLPPHALSLLSLLPLARFGFSLRDRQEAGYGRGFREIISSSTRKTSLERVSFFFFFLDS